MDIVSPIIDILTRLWDCTANRTAYIRHLDSNISSLTVAKDELDGIYNDVRQRVEREEEYYAILHQVRNWLEDVGSLIEEVDDILQNGNEEINKKCFASCCPRNCSTRYKLGKKVIDKINAVNESISKGHFDVVAAHGLPLPRDNQILVEKTVEMDSKVSDVWKFIDDPSVGIIGLHGTGGVGKSTLLKKLYSKFINTGYQNAIWVTVSGKLNGDVENIQNYIASKLGIPEDRWKNLDEPRRATEIHENLRRKEFGLFLDDLWTYIDLVKVGISIPDHTEGSKIIFTTRFEQVCDSMHVQKKYRVQYLSRQAALELFRQQVNEDVYSLPEIAKLAEAVANECGGLPLALVTIGRAMAGRREPKEWRDAINMIQNYPSELFTDMGREILSILKFSYDSLGDMDKECFLYCSVFPEDHKIRKDELIDLWIAEGFFKKYGTLDEARNKGEYIISSLERASLLERVEDSKDYVKMHDVLRDMALCLASKEEKETLVYEDDKRLEQEDLKRWEKAVRISLWGLKFKVLSKIRSSPRLLTFLARNTSLWTFPDAFFQSMHALKVLDLRRNYLLKEFPQEVSRLIHLEYLNLSESSIEQLPIEVKNLTRLRILLLDGTCKLDSIPDGVISSLSSLQVFSRLSTRRNWLPFQRFWDTTLLTELGRLEDMREIGLNLFTVNSIHQCLSSRLQNFVKRLILNCSELQSLDISHSTLSPASFFQNLHDLCIKNCSVKDLTCLIHAPRLQFLFVDECPILEEIIARDFGSFEIEENINTFENLRQLNFRGLPCLKSICRQALSFPSLERIYVNDCPNLRKLPLKYIDAEANSSPSIIGELSWWNQLEWEDEDTEHVFGPKFLPCLRYRSPTFIYEATTLDEIPSDPVAELFKAYKAYNPYMTSQYCGPSVEENPNACCIM